MILICAIVFGDDLITISDLIMIHAIKQSGSVFWPTRYTIRHKRLRDVFSLQYEQHTETDASFIPAKTSLNPFNVTMATCPGNEPDLEMPNNHQLRPVELQAATAALRGQHIGVTASAIHATSP